MIRTNHIAISLLFSFCLFTSGNSQSQFSKVKDKFDLSISKNKFEYINEVHKNHVNEVVFMDRNIDAKEVKEEYLKKKYTLGDEIVARVYLDKTIEEAYKEVYKKFGDEHFREKPYGLKYPAALVVTVNGVRREVYLAKTTNPGDLVTYRSAFYLDKRESSGYDKSVHIYPYLLTCMDLLKEGENEIVFEFMLRPYWVSGKPTLMPSENISFASGKLTLIVPPDVSYFDHMRRVGYLYEITEEGQDEEVLNEVKQGIIKDPFADDVVYHGGYIVDPQWTQVNNDLTGVPLYIQNYYLCLYEIPTDWLEKKEWNLESNKVAYINFVDQEKIYALVLYKIKKTITGAGTYGVSGLYTINQEMTSDFIHNDQIPEQLAKELIEVLKSKNLYVGEVLKL